MKTHTLFSIFYLALFLSNLPFGYSQTSQNLLENNGFEMGDPEEIENWKSSIGFGKQLVAISTTAPHEGKRHAALSVITDDSDVCNGGPGTGPARCAVAQKTIEGSVIPGKKYTLSFNASTPEGLYQSVAPRYLVEWLDQTNKPVGSQIFTGFADQVGKDGFYNEVSFELTAPPDADRANIIIDLEGGSANNPDSQESVLYLDNISFRENP